MTGRRSGHSARDKLLVLVLAAFAVIAAVAWLAEHVLILAGVALLIWAAYYGGRLHERRRTRPGQVHTAGPAAAAAVPVATLPLGDDWDELGTRQPTSLQAGPDRESLIAAPMSGVRPLWRSS